MFQSFKKYFNRHFENTAMFKPKNGQARKKKWMLRAGAVPTLNLHQNVAADQDPDPDPDDNDGQLYYQRSIIN